MDTPDHPAELVSNPVRRLRMHWNETCLSCICIASKSANAIVTAFATGPPIRRRYVDGSTPDPAHSC